MPPEARLQEAPDSDRLERVLSRALMLFVAAKVLLLAVAARRVRFVMDEMQFLSQIHDFGDGLYSVVDPIKTVLAAYLFALPRLISDESVGLLLGARAIGSVLGLIIATMVWRASRSLGGDRLSAWLAAAALFSFSTFSERGFRIRADLVSACFATVGLALACSASRPRWRAFGVGLAAGCAFVSTQKAIYVLVAFLLATLLAGSSGGWRERLGLAVRLFAGWVAVLLTYALVLGGADFVDVVRRIFLTPRQLAFEDYRAYPEIGRYLVQTLARNVVPWTLALIGIGHVAWSWRRRAPEVRWAAAASAVIVTLVFLHNQPWPYIFVLAVPFAAIWVPFAVRGLAGEAPRRRLEATAATVLLLAFSFPRNVRYVARHTNAAQLAVVRQAESMVGPSERYFDAIGMLPARRLALVFPEWWWDAPTIGRLRAKLAAGDASTFARLVAGRPKVWILNYRFRPLWPQVEAILRGAYVRVGEAVVVAGVDLGRSAQAVAFECRWPGRYRLFDHAGRPLDETVSVDDSEQAREVEIAVGTHRIRRSGSGPPAVLLPADTGSSGPGFAVRPLGAPVADLFAGVYDF